jgi:hypothetical protein
MSTRCNIVVSYGNTKVYLYRHCDGYAAETGADIVTKLQSKSDITATAFIGALLAERYDATSYDPIPRSVYEVTTDIHGDIEWLYAVRFSETRMQHNLYDVAFREIKIGDNTARTLLGLSYGTVDALIRAANEQRTYINARLEQAKKERPYFVYEPYAMLALPVYEASIAATPAVMPTVKMKIGEIRDIIRNASWLRRDLTGGTAEEFRKQEVGPRLQEKVTILKALVIAPRFAGDEARRNDEITYCEMVIARWNKARGIPS